MSRFDVIIFGATGFTGKSAISEAIDILKGFQWAVAGRDKEKIVEVMKEISKKMAVELSEVPIILADLEDEESLKGMASITKVLLNCAGPFLHTGESVARACIEQNTHYVDVSAEPYFMEKLQLDYNQKAKERKVYVIPGCAVFSIIAEMGTLFLEQKFDGTIDSIESYFEFVQPKNRSIFEPEMSVASLEGLFNRQKTEKYLPELRMKLFGEEFQRYHSKIKKRCMIHKAPFKGGHYATNFSDCNPSVVRRSQQYFYEKSRKRPIKIREYLTNQSFLIILLLAFLGPFFSFLLRFVCYRYLLKRFPRILTFGVLSEEGPSDNSVKNSSFTNIFYAKGWSKATNNLNSQPDKKITVKIISKKSPYLASGALALLASVTILEDHLKMPDGGGVLPPRAAFSETNLMQRLQKHGYQFEIIKDE